MATRRQRRVILGVIGVAVVALVVAFLGPYVYIHFIEGPAPSKLELPKTPATASSTTAGTATSTTPSFDGTWNVGTGSIAGYRVQEVLIGQSATAVGRTSKI